MSDVTPTSTPEVTIGELVTQVRALQEQNNQLQLIVSQTGKVKLVIPDKYRGDKGELTRFLTQMQAYLQYYPEKFDRENAKTLFIALHLEAKVLRQFESTLKDYLKFSEEDARDDFTNKVFNDYKEFEKEIQKVFRDTDEKLYAQERLGRLR